MKRSVIGFVAGMLFVGCATAAESGLYAGAGIGQVKISDEIEGFSYEADDTAFKVFGGYKFNPNFAIEAAYIDAGQPSDNILGVDVDVDASAFQTSFVANLPFNDTIAGFAKAGILFWDSTTTASDGFDSESFDDSGNEFAWGVGLAMSIGDRTRADLTFEGADIGGTDYRMISLGMSWAFQ